MDFDNLNESNANKYEVILSQLDSQLPDIFLRVKEEHGVIDQQTLGEIIAELAIEFNYDFTDVSDFFLEARHPDDREDFVNLYDMTLQQVTTRLKNYLFEKIHDHNQEGTLDEFIKRRKLSNYVARDFEKPSSLARKNSQPFVKQQTLRKQTVQQETPQEPKVEIDDFEEPADDPKEPTDAASELIENSETEIEQDQPASPIKLRNPTKDTFIERLAEVEDEARDVFFEHGVQEAFQFIINRCRLKASPEQQAEFNKVNKELDDDSEFVEPIKAEVAPPKENDSDFDDPVITSPKPEEDFEDAFPPSPEKAPKPNLDWDGFHHALFTWFEEQSPEVLPDKSLDLKEKLQKTIEEYEKLMIEAASEGMDTDHLDKLVETLRLQLDSMDKPAEPDPKVKQKNDREKAELLKKHRAGLHEIFIFYAKQQQMKELMIGRKAGFDDLITSINTFNMGKFLKVLRDFGIMDVHKRKDRKVITREEAKVIYLENSDFQARKVMDESKFMAALNAVAEKYYDAEWETINQQKVVHETQEQKRDRLYNMIESHDPKKYKSKIQPFNLPFNSRQPINFRIPENDPSRNYQYKPYIHQRMDVSEWKRQKGLKALEKSKSSALLKSNFRSSKATPASSRLGPLGNKNFTPLQSDRQIPKPKAKPAAKKSKKDEMAFLFGDSSESEDSEPELFPASNKNSTYDLRNKISARADQLDAMEKKKQNELMRSISTQRMPFEDTQQRVLNKYKR